MLSKYVCLYGRLATKMKRAAEKPNSAQSKAARRSARSQCRYKRVIIEQQITRKPTQRRATSFDVFYERIKGSTDDDDDDDTQIPYEIHLLLSI